MPAIELTVSPRIADALFELTDEEFAQLEANILADGSVTDPLLYWVKDGKNILVDGNNRWKIIQKHGLTKYSVKEIKFDDWPDVILWVKHHWLGRRRGTPAAEKKILGDIYNMTKASHGGSRSSPQNEDLNKEAEKTSEEVAKDHGVSKATVERAGAYAANLDKVSAPVRREILSGDLKLTDADVAALATADAPTQQQIARDVQVGEVSTLREAMAKRGIVKPKAKPSVPPLDLDGIATELHKKFNAMNPRPSKNEISKLRTYEDSEQVEIYRTIGGEVTSVMAAIKLYEKEGLKTRDAAKQEIPEHMLNVMNDMWFSETRDAMLRIVTECKVRLQKTPFSMIDLAPLVESMTDYARKIGDCQPSVVCPVCKGAKTAVKTCTHCRNTGYMPAWVYHDWKAKQPKR